MKPELIKAKTAMESGGYTCVLIGNGAVLSDKRRGIRPLLAWLDEDKDLKGFCAADRVVGKAAAMLYVLMGVSQVYAGVMSRSAADTLKEFGIDAFWGELVERIVNRSGTGFCPMESAVMDIDSPEIALTVLRQKLIQMQQKEIS